MNILQFGPYPLDTDLIKGGIESSIYGLSHSLSSKHSILVIPFPKKDIKEDIKRRDGNVEIHFLKNFFSYDILSIFRINKILNITNDFNPAFCHLHGSSLLCLIFALFLKYKKIPFVITIHGLLHIEFLNQKKTTHRFIETIKYYIYSFIEYKLLNINQKYIVDTYYVKDCIMDLIKAGKVRNDISIHVIPQGINENYYQINDNFHKFNILSVGSISSRKGHLFTIKAIQQLSAKFPLIRLYIAGVKTDTVYFQLLIEYIFKNKIEKFVTIFTDVSQKEIYNLYSQANIFTLHSEEESQGIVLCEAMACGKPIVATNVGGIPYIVQNNVNGLLSNYGDIEAFKNNIIKIVQNNELRTSFHNNNLLTAKKFSWITISEQIIRECYIK
jgi:glycosyltransferase involved in cell wall biosynthesis